MLDGLDVQVPADEPVLRRRLLPDRGLPLVVPRLLGLVIGRSANCRGCWANTTGSIQSCQIQLLVEIRLPRRVVEQRPAAPRAPPWSAPRPPAIRPYSTGIARSAADTVTEYAIPTATGTPPRPAAAPDPPRCRPASPTGRRSSTATGTRCSASSAATSSAATGPAFPVSGSLEEHEPAPPLERRHRRSEQQPLGRPPGFQRRVITERAVQVEMDDLIPARPVRPVAARRCARQRLPGPRPHQIHRHRQPAVAARPAAAGTPSGTPHPPARPAGPSPPECSAPAGPRAARTSTPADHPAGHRHPHRQRHRQIRVPQRLPVQPVKRRRPAHLQPAPVKPPVPQPPVVGISRARRAPARTAPARSRRYGPTACRSRSLSRNGIPQMLLEIPGQQLLLGPASAGSVTVTSYSPAHRNSPAPRTTHPAAASSLDPDHLPADTTGHRRAPRPGPPRPSHRHRQPARTPPPSPAPARAGCSRATTRLTRRSTQPCWPRSPPAGSPPALTRLRKKPPGAGASTPAGPRARACSSPPTPPLVRRAHPYSPVHRHHQTPHTTPTETRSLPGQSAESRTVAPHLGAAAQFQRFRRIEDGGRHVSDASRQIVAGCRHPFSAVQSTARDSARWRRFSDRSVNFAGLRRRDVRRESGHVSGTGRRSAAAVIHPCLSFRRRPGAHARASWCPFLRQPRPARSRPTAQDHVTSTSLAGGSRSTTAATAPQSTDEVYRPGWSTAQR